MSELELPHAAGCAICLECDKRWYAIWPLGADALECPRCGSVDTEREIIDRDKSGKAVAFRPEPPQ